MLERASVKSYDELLQEHVAKPAGATTIRHVSQRDILPGRASSFLPAGDVVLNAPLRDLSFLVGGGSVYTTPRDIHLVMRGLVTGVYGDAARTALLRPNGLRWNGVTNGFRAFADWHNTDSLAVIFFGNAHTGAIDLLRREIPRMAAGENVAAAIVPTISAVALTDATRARLAGQYDTGGGSRATLTFVSPKLALFGDRPLAALNDSTFFSFADYAHVTFVSRADGQVDAIEWGPGTWGTGEKGPRFARAR